MRKLTFALPMLLAVTAACVADITLVHDGRPVATIYHLDQDGAAEIAEELRHYVEAVSGASMTVRPITLIQLSEGTPGPSVILAYGRDAIGAAGLQQMGLPVGELQPEGFLQAADDAGYLAVVALDLAGLRYGVYDLLEQVGVRWYMPAELGEQVPERATISFERFTNLENPDFILRHMWLAYGRRPGTENEDYDLWRMRNKMGGVRANMGHNLAKIISPADYAETHPEYFPLIGGERRPPDGTHGWQPCTSNADVVRIAAEKARAAFDEDPELWSFSLSPNDGWGGWCECDDCVALDPPEYRDNPRHGKARRILVFANSVAELLEETHPDRHVAFYAYAPTVEPPDDPPAHPRVAIAVAHYASVSDKFRPITDPTSPSNAGYIPIVEGWANVTDRIFAREYYTGLVQETDGLTRVAAAYALVEDIPWYHRHNVVGINSEALGMWGNVGLNFYLTAKMMWDIDTDVEAVLDDYFPGMYGPAAAPMREYFETLRDIARERYQKTELLTEEDFPPLRALLDRAMEFCETDRQRGRVQLSIDHFDYVRLLRRMYETAREEDIAAVHAFVDARPDSLGFDRKMHRSAFTPPERTEIPDDLRYDGPEVIPASDAAPRADALGVSPAVRHESIWLAIPGAGEAFEVAVTPRQMGRHMAPTGAELLDPAGNIVAALNVGVKATESVEIPRAEAGMYTLRMSAGRQAAQATSTARAFVLVGADHNFVGPTPRLYFLPDPAAEELTVRLESTPPGETAAITVWDPSGEQVFTAHTHGQVAVVGETFALSEANRGAAWSLKIDAVPDEYIEDALVRISGTVPYLATDPARLVRPVQ
ncbi:MAG: DUF4838 domain-containing protein [Armatimonadota bacterium]|jgi:hypothetical protein